MDWRRVKLTLCYYFYCRIVVGFVTDATSGTNMAISDCDFELYQHGENGIPAKDYAFTFAAGKTDNAI